MCIGNLNNDALYYNFTSTKDTMLHRYEDGVP